MQHALVTPLDQGERDVRHCHLRRPVAQTSLREQRDCARARTWLGMHDVSVHRGGCGAVVQPDGNTPHSPASPAVPGTRTSRGAERARRSATLDASGGAPSSSASVCLNSTSSNSLTVPFTRACQLRRQAEEHRVAMGVRAGTQSEEMNRVGRTRMGSGGRRPCGSVNDWVFVTVCVCCGAKGGERLS